MSVYHITLHGYRTWRADNKRGYVDKKNGLMKPDPKKQQQWDEKAKHPKVGFDREMQAVLISGAHDICTRRSWRLHGVGTDPTHGHFAISWRGYLPWEEVRRVLKNILSLMFGRLKGAQGRRWFETGDSDRQVLNRDHLDYLLKTYFPDHRGLHWIEGQPLPEVPSHVIGETSKKKAVRIPKKRNPPKKK